MRFYDPCFKMLQKKSKNFTYLKNITFSEWKCCPEGEVAISPKSSIFAARLKQNQNSIKV